MGRTQKKAKRRFSLVGKPETVTKVASESMIAHHPIHPKSPHPEEHAGNDRLRPQKKYEKVYEYPAGVLGKGKRTVERTTFN